MKNTIKLLLVLALTFSANNLFSQGCFNANFSDNSFLNWQGFTGTCCGINTPNVGIVPGQHTIMTGTGVDPWACTPITVVAPGETYSAMLGNSGTGAQAERLRYVFNITPSSNMIIFKYAVVLEDPGHTIAQQPRFEAQLSDSIGNPIPCTFYQVTSGNGIPGFQACGQIRSKDWTTIGVNVSGYLGQQIILDVATGDCSLGGHFGYAYVVADCASLYIESRYCENSLSQTVELEAPDGFANYVWTDSTGTVVGNGQIITLNTTNQQTITCAITSVNGCTATLSTEILPSNVVALYTMDSVCAGGVIDLNNISVFTNAIQDTVTWSSSDGYSVLGNTFSHTFPGPGDYTVQMIVESDANCQDTVTNTIHVYNIPVSDFNFANVCLGEEAQLNSISSIASLDSLTNLWVINVQDTLIGDTTVYDFTQPGLYNIDLITTSQFGCADTSSQSITVFNNPTANFTFTEQCIDVAVPFTNTTSNVSPITSFEWYQNGTFLDTTINISYLYNAPGLNTMTLIALDSFPNNVVCDDTLTLTLFVHDNPVLAYAADTVLCEDVPFTITSNSTVTTTEVLSYNWTTAGNSIGNNSNLNYVITTPGISPINYTATTAFGCATDTTFNLYVMTTPNEPILSITTPDCPGDPIFITALGESNSTINWTGPNNFTSTSFNVMMPITQTGMGAYISYLVSQYGCISDTASIVADIANIGTLNDFDFPNVITANNDNTNDVLDLKSYFSTCDAYTCYIFNRWGQLLFEQGQDTPQFMGKTQDGEELVPGVYFYKLVFQDFEKQGYIHVIR